MKATKWIIAAFCCLFTAALSATEAPRPPIPDFKKLKSESSTALECTFDFRSRRTKERFIGRFALSRTGDSFFLIRRNQDQVHECRLDLRVLNPGSSSMTRSTTILADRVQACSPELDGEIRKRLANSVRINLSHLNKNDMSIETIYLEGPRPCQKIALDEPTLTLLAKRVAAKPPKTPATPSEPIDIENDIRRAKNLKID